MKITEEESYNSDEEIDKKKHNRLLNEVLQLDQRALLKKPSRTEATNHVSEFNLIKSVKQSINLNDLTKSLKSNQSKHAAIGNKIKSAQKAKTLHKPLEKPQAERIRRTVGFKKTKSNLNKWNSIVEKNRVASQITYPLNQDEIDMIVVPDKSENPTKRYKSELDIELEKLEPQQVETINVEEKFPLSMEEIIQRRKEVAKLRAHQSYQEAKAYKRNKIKSKTYHRIRRKEKLKQQIREFEMLQKTDPEEALRKLEQLEKTRVEERMSLRHRSTGAWAKSKQVRAKYDKESRQALAQQLSLSRELTQKLVDDSSDSEVDLAEAPPQNDPSNPWLGKSEGEVGDFITGYRKYWDEKNKNEEIQTKQKKPPKTQVVHCNSSWTVTSTDDKLQHMFEDLEGAARSKAKQKLQKLQKDLTTKVEKKKKKCHNKTPTTTDDSVLFKRERELRPDLDDELQNMEENNKSDDDDDTTNLLKLSKQPLNKSADVDIDPNKYLEAVKIKTKATDLDSEIPLISQGDDTDSDSDVNSTSNDQKHFIEEAFADDDIVSDFAKEKSDLINNSKPKDIDLSLPGWGEWGGKTIQPSKRKRKRFIVKMPKDLPRRDQNKGHLIINEHKSKDIKKHQVSEIPFPFTSVKDFEASIRAPIGDTFVPQTAFRRLIKPAIVTKKGAIIEPMTDNILLKQKFTQHGFMINKK